ncbi:hypothetical protein NQ314_000739 [Rhamnusium bicolor]|uniref:DUF7869 domain-containing protein n=1 Tax=Rhamnusium bicolor TaxID=1586634 RepID=A0AAV8ZTP4_9CUCU|nr:hypothetical protein NQ314_000739 [Rhamnusium bicolor]
MERNNIQTEYDAHLNEATKRYDLKKRDKNDFFGKSNGRVLMVDLQKCLATPLLTNAQSFYSLKLWSFNYTIYDSTYKKATCCMWDETIAGRGGPEMASCMIKYILSLNDDIENIIIWSDNCPPQNRNIQMIMCYFYLMSMKPAIKKIEHKYLLRGHTHMELDTMHSQIERELKKTPACVIVTTWDRQQFARLSSSRSHEFQIFGMETEDFKNINALFDEPTSPFCNTKNSKKNRR